ncbi:MULTISPECIES: hypothetical protein [unclassified Acinetobacter]|uniref:hypothetical protein n=1 Tax=unclassified Acinetobacter TaxID=196816 RepID=UPI00244D0D11|nr:MULTISPECIES: hypothetical protein [unclassified Acinetobacter]MDH0032527.1 hypothetical protein [Acinetobacter sp. GD04021]MDH0885218.1 hypothetical protein [Acinetobacter sp. GD03873]MDH1084454.1 hypothetical protein [Acinetobacter sp. GD03983]MDH2188342.1 hypothetical protein [Acinetobacter sp. GD03645]MDH2203853.1 hypothetical protein [Acinetobacter sp. GD03647]
MATLQERISEPLQAFSQHLSPEQVLEALSKNIGIEYTEVDTSDWTFIEKNCPVSIADIYSGFLKFRFSMKTFETQRFKEKSAKFFCEYLNNDGDGNERYRLGFENPTIIVLKRNEDSKLHHGLKKSFTWGFYLNGFDFYREQNGQLVDITPSEKQFENLYKARQAKERSRKAAHLDKKGFFKDLPPHQRKILG